MAYGVIFEFTPDTIVINGQTIDPNSLPYYSGAVTIDAYNGGMNATFAGVTVRYTYITI
jgi:hypothetical protein